MQVRREPHARILNRRVPIADHGQIAVAHDRPQGHRTAILDRVPADGDPIRFEIEIRPWGDAFAGTATAATALLSSGETAVLTAALPPGLYAWKYRPVDSLGASGPWARFGSGSEAGPDFRIEAAGSYGSSNCLHTGGRPGSPVRAWIAALLIAGFLLRRE